MKTSLATLFMAALFACQLSKGSSPPGPKFTATCNNDHSVDITISNVDDIDQWTEVEWQLEGSSLCQPTFNGTTITYTRLALPDCANTTEKLEDGSIKYTLEINPVITDTFLSLSYEHRYSTSCTYESFSMSFRIMASFAPIKSRTGADPKQHSNTGSFTFSLDVYPQSDHTGTVSNPVALDQTLYFKASVSTASSSPNLDLYPSACWASKSSNPDSTDGRVVLILQGCGHSYVSEDLSDTLSYTCASDSTEETFSISSFRYVGASDGDSVYFHCDLKVCLADTVNSTCECLTDRDCGGNPERRKRRSYKESIDETQVYHVKAGPFIIKNNNDQENENNEVNKKGGSDKQDEFQPFSINFAIVVAVSGVVLIAIACAIVVVVVQHRYQATSLSLLAEITAPISSPLDTLII